MQLNLSSFFYCAQKRCKHTLYHVNTNHNIMLHRCNKLKSYDVWILRYWVCIKQNFLPFWTIFCTFIPLTHPKNQDFEKMKKEHLEILSFYSCVPWITVTWCMVPKIWNAIDRIFCHFGHFFVLLLP